MVSITIDGRRLEVEEGKHILTCALENGIYIPHLCHHPALPENGSCRMCVVEVKGEAQPVAACLLEAEDGMEIITRSERLTHLRTLAMELLLSGHPEDCSSCPKYGNCELQTLILYIGASNSRLQSRSRGMKINEENPLLIHDMNRCVLCGRCVRACNDLRGVGVLQYTKKELELCVDTLHGKLLKEENCRFCTACAQVCPTGTIRDKVQLMNTGLKKEDAYVPCRYTCPIHTEIPKYIRFVKEKNYDAAAAVIREKAPFPKVLGYICSHVCESECRRGEVNEPVSIRNIKRYAAEKDTGKYWKGKGKQLPDTGKSICVAGAGPAGLTAAYYLRKQGHTVKVAEALPEAGGMMRYGIPEYRLPRNIIAEEIQVILNQGVILETNRRIEQPLTLKKEYDAVLLAVGTHQGIRLPIEGSKLPGVLLNIDFLRKVSMGEKADIGEKVIVLGGGNVAFDCARTARCLGATEISLACLESLDNMPADKEEIQQAKEEGINIYPARTFEKITGTENVTGVDFMKVKTFTFDKDHKAVIEKEEHSEHHIEADTVIFAVGQRNAMEVPEDTEGVFAAGDAVYGTKSVVQAIAAGRNAAVEIDKYLGGDGDISERFAPEQSPNPWIGKIEDFPQIPRVTSKIIAPKQRADNFGQIDYGICDGDICRETQRCLQCDLRLQIEDAQLWNQFAERQGE
ncbi:Glutamate synthase [NADPH] small chain [uncultured Roseburia sp.]|uniref:FAD-dependent oxidoreductase n=1 Tax=Brotonthovivens ammoniilytica TaxID=2981725 RepID=A0ABT2TGK4_9FIRM|nr:FAD-dependent oxidoreductase [Brotonthovivens ammoniilytica]MCU6760846.1 FAD-dependent oxidoreductase [Brotonthovivens ammoniilytica]SCI11060.1 Glutamate synthase [NADPH] small chain [uncultured Roseburia sp.]